MYQNYFWDTERKMPTGLSSGAQCCGFQPNNCCELQRVISGEKAKKFASTFGVAEVDSRPHCWHSHNTIFIHERRCWTLDVTTLPALDEFYFYIVKVPKFKELSSLLKIILRLSHGQDDVERGFSLSSGVLKENIADKSIVVKGSSKITFCQATKSHMLWILGKSSGVLVTKQGPGIMII